MLLSDSGFSLLVLRSRAEKGAGQREAGNARGGLQLAGRALALGKMPC